MATSRWCALRRRTFDTVYDAMCLVSSYVLGVLGTHGLAFLTCGIDFDKHFCNPHCPSIADRTFILVVTTFSI